MSASFVSLNSMIKPLQSALLFHFLFSFLAITQKEALSSSQAVLKASPRDAKCPGEGWKCRAGGGIS